MKEKYYKVSSTISRWKINNKLENYLGYKADNSEFWKWVYVKFYQIFDNEYFKGGLLLSAKEIEKQKQNLSSIINIIGFKNIQKDMIYCLHRFGASFGDYFLYHFYEMNTLGRESFNNLKIQYGYCEQVNDTNVRDLFEDKGALYKILSKYYKREICAINSDNQKEDFSNFVSNHNSFIYKPIKGHSGIGIQIFRDVTDINTLFNRLISDGPFILEELIHQHASIAVLHPQSINTIRIATFVNREDVAIYGAALRMGVANSNIDNANSGGIFAAVDINTGIVCSRAQDIYSNYYSVHPDTRYSIVGYQIPEWDKALLLAKTVSKEIKGATVISWDLAYSDKGWLIVEGNDVGDPYLLQAPLGKGIKKEVISLIDKYLEIKGNK